MSIIDKEYRWRKGKLDTDWSVEVRLKMNEWKTGEWETVFKCNSLGEALEHIEAAKAHMQTRQRSREMDKEQLIKLAEVAGYEVIQCDVQPEIWRAGIDGIDIHTIGVGWQPHKDISQAMELLEGLDCPEYSWNVGGPDHAAKLPYCEIGKNVYKKSYDYVETSAETLPEAICNAVLKAMEQGNG